VRVSTLRRRSEFQAAYRQGVKTSGRFVVIFGLLRAEGGCRFGITATRRLGGAVVRNRARRRIRELFRRHGEALQELSIDVVVNARDGCASAPWTDVGADFVRCVTTLRRRLSPPVS
jgi:ribonuclease P protein component